MEIQPLTWEAILNLLRERAARKRDPLIVEARIAVDQQEACLLELKPVRPMKIISY